MGQEIDLLDRYPRSPRPIDERGACITAEHRAVARRFDREFFDGDRLYGYGGYHYHPRFWTETVRRFRDHYDLSPDAAVLDVGCGKGFLLHDFRQAMPRMTVRGVDISSYAAAHAIEDVRPFVVVGDAKALPYPDGAFDLVVSINAVHNLAPAECVQALREIQRVTRRHAFVTVDAWRTDAERERLLKWNLTALTYGPVDEWRQRFDEAGYAGDYYWFIAE
ncbi:MAG: class I SAM-dependent methyltransferase [Candidatus Binatia bacterium]